jgi:serine phosphatase RsbU (regulator of sigma subunit)/pSer/pThr/pTyr-binding forkhead associated (FHA) protein
MPRLDAACFPHGSLTRRGAREALAMTTSDAPAAPLRLRVEPPNATPFEHVADGDQLLVGRSQDAGLVIGDPQVSRQHMRFVRRGDEWTAEDLGARNGTLLNGRALLAPTRVGPGDVLQLGCTSLWVDAGPMTLATSDRSPALDLPRSLLVPAADLARELQPGETTFVRDQAAERLVGRLRLLNDVYRALAAPLSETALCELILDRAFAAFDPEEGVILLEQPDGTLAPAATRRPLDADGEPTVSARLVEEVVRKGAAALVVDAALDDRFADATGVAGAGIRSLLAAPIADASGSLGMIALYSRARVRRFTKPDLELLVSLASAAALRLRSMRVAEEAARRRVRERELELAHGIRADLLPQLLPQHDDLEMAATPGPALSAGEGFYDVFLDDAGRLWFMVAEVDGGGLDGTLGMAVVRTLFRGVAQAGTPPRVAFERTHAELTREGVPRRPVTIVTGCLDPASGRLELGNAGSAPTFVLRNGGGLEDLSNTGGIGPGAGSATTAAMLSPGDAVVLCTNGIPRATAAAGDPFSRSRLEVCLRASATSTAAVIVESVLDAVRTFTREASTHGDTPIVVIRLRDRAPTSRGDGR